MTSDIQMTRKSVSFVNLQERQDLQVPMVFQDRPVRWDSRELQVIPAFQVVQVLKAGQDHQEVRVFQDQQDHPDSSVLQVQSCNEINFICRQGLHL